MTNKAFLFWAPGSHPTSVDSGTSWHPYNRKKSASAVATFYWQLYKQVPVWTDKQLVESKLLSEVSPEQSCDSMMKYHRLKVCSCCPFCPFHTVPGASGAWEASMMTKGGIWWCAAGCPHSELPLRHHSSGLPMWNNLKAKMNICTQKSCGINSRNWDSGFVPWQNSNVQIIKTPR